VEAKPSNTAVSIEATNRRNKFFIGSILLLSRRGLLLHQPSHYLIFAAQQ
jgi:hypothetical protein